MAALTKVINKENKNLTYHYTGWNGSRFEHRTSVGSLRLLTVFWRESAIGRMTMNLPEHFILRGGLNQHAEKSGKKHSLFPMSMVITA